MPPQRSSNQRTTAIVVVSLVGVLVLLVGAVAISVLGSDSPSRTGSPDVSMEGEGVLLLPGEASAPAEAITVLRGFSEGTTRYEVVRVRFDEETGEDAIVWRTKVASDVLLGDVVLRLTGQGVYVGIEETVTLLDLNDGATIWTAALTDRLDIACNDCFQLVGDALLVRTYDGMLSRFGPDAPEPVWTRRLSRTSAQLVVAGDQPMVIDAEEGGTSTQLQALSLETGEILRASQPACADDPEMAEPLFSVQGRVVAVPGTSEVVVLTGVATGCAVRLDPATGEQVWASELPEDFSSFDGDRFLIDDEHLVLQLATNLLRVDLATGEQVELDALPDLRIDPIRIVDGLLVAETTTERGTPRTGLAGFDLSTGRSTWVTETGTDQSDLASVSDPRRADGTVFDQAKQRQLLIDAGGQTQVVTFSNRQPSVVVRPLDLTSGELGPIVSRDYSENDRDDSDLVVLLIEARGVLVDAENSLQLIPLPDGDIQAWPGD